MNRLKNKYESKSTDHSTIPQHMKSQNVQKTCDCNIVINQRWAKYGPRVESSPLRHYTPAHGVPSSILSTQICCIKVFFENVAQKRFIHPCYRSTILLALNEVDYYYLQDTCTCPWQKIQKRFGIDHFWPIVRQGGCCSGFGKSNQMLCQNPIHLSTQQKYFKIKIKSIILYIICGNKEMFQTNRLFLTTRKHLQNDN